MSVRSWWREERGSATIAGAYVIAALAMLVVLILYVGAAVLARHRAQSAADLAALAAASQQVAGAGSPCEAARRIVSAQEVSVRMVRCETKGEDVVISVAVPVSLGHFGIRQAEASARAGPVG